MHQSGNNTDIETSPGQALTQWGTGTAIVRLLGNENRAVGWRLALNLAARHLAIAYTQGIELSQHPVIREALRVRGGREAILDPRSVAPIPITLAAQIFSGGALDLRPGGKRDVYLDLEFVRRVWMQYGADIIEYERQSWKGMANSTRNHGFAP